MENIKLINKELLKRWGKTDDGRPYFRLSWAPDQREKRFGAFNKFLKGTDIFLGTEKGVFDRLKYPWAGERWMLEKLSFPPRRNAFGSWEPKFIGIWNGSYEPVWCFRDKDGNYQIPNMRACMLLCRAALLGPEVIRTPGSTEDEESLEDKQLLAKLFDFWDNELPATATALHDGDGIVVPSNYEGGQNAHDSLIVSS